MSTWSDTTIIGDVFLRVAPFLKSYTQYCNNYPNAMALYNEKKASNPKFAKFIDVRFHDTSLTHVSKNKEKHKK